MSVGRCQGRSQSVPVSAITAWHVRAAECHAQSAKKLGLRGPAGALAHSTHLRPASSTCVLRPAAVERACSTACRSLSPVHMHVVMDRQRLVSLVTTVASTVPTRAVVALLNTSAVYERAQLLADREPHALRTSDVYVDTAAATGPRITLEGAWRTGAAGASAATARIVIGCTPDAHFQGRQCVGVRAFARERRAREENGRWAAGGTRSKGRGRRSSGGAGRSGFHRTSCTCSAGSNGRCRHVGAYLFLFLKDPASCVGRRVVGAARGAVRQRTPGANI